MTKPFAILFSLLAILLALFLVTFGGFIAFAILLLGAFLFAFLCQDDAETTFYSLFVYPNLFALAAGPYVFIRDCVHFQNIFTTILVTAILFPPLLLLGAILLSRHARKHYSPQPPALPSVLFTPTILLLSTTACAIIAASCLAKLFPKVAFYLCS